MITAADRGELAHRAGATAQEHQVAFAITRRGRSGAECATSLIRTRAAARTTSAVRTSSPQREILELAFAALGRPPRLHAIPRGALVAANAVVRVFSPPAADLVRSLARLAEFGGVAPATDTHHLADCFAELARYTQS